MTLNNDQISTVLLLIETSQLPEPELSEAWDLLNYIQGMKMAESNYPTCPQCDCVKGCQSNPVPCPNLPATKPVVVDDYADTDEMNTLHGESYGVDWTYPPPSKKDEPFGWVATWKGQASKPAFYPGWEPPNALDHDWNEHPVSIVPVYKKPIKQGDAK